MEILNAFSFCRYHQGYSTAGVLCSRFGTVESCGPCSVCPKCAGRMILDDGIHNATELAVRDAHGAKCRLCGFRKSVHAVVQAEKQEDHELESVLPEPEERLDEIEPEIEEKPEEPEMPAGRKTQMGSKKKIAQCADCKRVMPITARDLCGKCYAKHQRNKTLDEKFPSSGVPFWKPSAPVKTETKPAEIEPLKEETSVKDGCRCHETDGPALNTPILEGVRVYKMEAVLTRERTEMVVPVRNDDRDKEILAWLEKKAYTNRREVGCEILAVLEKVMTDEGWMEDQLAKV